MSFLSGPYAWFLGAAGFTITSPTPTQTELNNYSLGVIEDAPTFRFAREGDPITGDNLGAAIQGVVDRGGNLFVDMIFQELDPDAVLRAWWPYDPSPTTASPNTAGIPNQLGRIATATRRTIGRLTPTYELRGIKLLNSGEVDDTIEPGVGRLLHLLRIQNAQLAPGFDIAQLVGSRLRNVGVSFLGSPFFDDPDTVYWTQS